MDGPRRRAGDPRLLRPRRGGQDDGCRGHGRRGRPPGPADGRRHHRPGQAPGRRPSASTTSPTPPAHRGRLARRAVGLMLDARSTFDGLVVTYAADPEQAEIILANRFYRNIAGRCRAPRSTWPWRSCSSCTATRASNGRRRHPPHTQRPRLRRRPAAHPPARQPPVPPADDAGPDGHRAVNIATQAFLRTIRQVGRLRGGVRRGDVLPGLRGHGGRLPPAGQRVLELLSDPAARSSWSPPPGATRPGRRSSSPRSSRTTASTWRPGRQPHAPPIPGGVGGVPELASLYRTWPSCSGWRRRGGPRGGLSARVGAPALRVPELETDVHDLPGLARVAGYVFA